MVYKKYSRNKYTRKRNKYTRKKKIQKGGAIKTPSPQPPVKHGVLKRTRNFTKGTGALIGRTAISGVGLVPVGIKTGLEIVPGVLHLCTFKKPIL
jgi:hypothetical protein